MVAAAEEGLKAIAPGPRRGRVPRARRPGPRPIPAAAWAAFLSIASAAPSATPAHPAAASPVAPAAARTAAAKPLAYMCYSPYRDGQSPGGAAPTEAQIRADLALIVPLAKGVRTYGATGIQARIPALAREAGLEVYPGAWIGTDDAANLAEVDALIALAKSGNPAIKGLIVGSETLLRGDVTEERLVGYLKRVREAGTGIPVSTADIYQNVISHAAALDPVVDFALCHIHPYWESVAPGNAAARVLQGWQSVKAKYPGKPVLVGETGFPTAGQAQGAAVPGEAAQADFLADLAGVAAANGIPIMWFEAFDEAWKSGEGAVGAHWGLWNTDRSEKPALARLRAATGLAWRPPRPRMRPGAGGAAGDPIPAALRTDALGRLRAAQAAAWGWDGAGIRAVP